jgi:FKBP-type peptidyl-prolyl cis-trans isomerase SlyD
LENGEIFDLTKESVAKKEKIYNPKINYKPVPIVLGEKFVFPALETELEKMKIGEKKEVILEPQKAFGERKLDMIKTLPESKFPNKPRVGMIVNFGEFKGRIQSVSSGRVRVDCNHPLAGKRLKYELEIVRKIEDNERIPAIMKFFGIEKFNVDGKRLEINAKMHDIFKQRVSDLVTKYTDIEEVLFVEKYLKSSETKEIEPSKSSEKKL